MAVPAVIVLAVGLLVAQLVFERHGMVARRLVAKTLLSVLFVGVAVWQPSPVPAYGRLLVTGLGLCLVGDVLLAVPGLRPFLAGLVAFLLGHVAYVLAFVGLAPVGPATLVGLLATGAASASVFGWLRPHLGRMLLPVVAYVVIITLMVAAASGVLGAPALPVPARAAVFVGALSFYLSDLFVARQRFVAKGFVNRLVGLPLYYAGQFLLAFSIGLVG